MRNKDDAVATFASAHISCTFITRGLLLVPHDLDTFLRNSIVTLHDIVGKLRVTTKRQICQATTLCTFNSRGVWR